MRSSRLYFAVRSARAGAPVLICPAPVATNEVGDRRVLRLCAAVRDDASPAGLRRLGVVVFDDFITEGYASEVSRNWLLQLGAADVVSVSIGKYGTRYSIETPTDAWDPCRATTGLTFSERTVAQQVNPDALPEFRERFDGFRREASRRPRVN